MKAGDEEFLGARTRDLKHIKNIMLRCTKVKNIFEMQGDQKKRRGIQLES